MRSIYPHFFSFILLIPAIIKVTNLKSVGSFISSNLKILFLSIAIGLFACAISIFAFSSPGSNQPPNGNPTFWLLNGTSMYYSGGNVGVGTNSPNLPLEIDNSAGLSAVTSSPMGGQLLLGSLSHRLYLGSFYSAGVAELAAIQSSAYYSGADHAGNLSLNPNGGNVGIGTSSPSGILHTYVAINGQPIFESGSGMNFIKLLSHTGQSNYGSDIAFFDGSTNSAEIKSVASGGLYFATTNTNRLAIDGSGNVGIGIMNPAATLHIYPPGTAYSTAFKISNPNGNGGSCNFYVRQGCGGTDVSLGSQNGVNFCMNCSTTP